MKRYPPSGDISFPPDGEWEAALHSAQRGDERAFEMIYKELNPRLARYCASQCYGSTLDDGELLAETWISVSKDIAKFKGEFYAFKAWVYSIARNRIRDGARRRERLLNIGISVDEVQDSEIVQSAHRIESLIESDEAVAKIVREIKQLPDVQAEVILLRIVADMSIEETAKILGKSENTVRVQAHRGLATLRECMAGVSDE